MLRPSQMVRAIDDDGKAGSRTARLSNRSAAFLRVHGSIGGLDNFGRRSVVRIERDADAGGHEDRMRVANGKAGRALEMRMHTPCRQSVVADRENHAEFVAANIKRRNRDLIPRWRPSKGQE
jgi:hypothetical protein